MHPLGYAFGDSQRGVGALASTSPPQDQDAWLIAEEPAHSVGTQIPHGGDFRDRVVALECSGTGHTCGGRSAASLLRFRFAGLNGYLQRVPLVTGEALALVVVHARI